MSETMHPTVWRKWRWLFVHELDWRHVGLGVEFSFGYWWPREWSIYLQLGPMLVGGGREHDLAAEYAEPDDADGPERGGPAGDQP